MQQKGVSMTISSSLNAGVAGLTANASRLAAISDNIANSGTFGYKRMESDFQSMVISGNSGAYSAGGVRATTQRLIDERGSLVSTSNPTDLAVRGRGFLPVAKSTDVAAGNGASQMLLTTTGSFRTDAEGFLKTESGLMLMGWPALADGSIPTFPRDTSAGLEPVQINVNQFSGEPTSRIGLGVNLPATETDAAAPGDPRQLSVEYIGNLGQSESVDVTFTPSIPAAGASNQWTMQLRDTASGGALIGEYDLQFDNTRGAGGTLQSVTTLSGGAYDPATGALTSTSPAGRWKSTSASPVPLTG